MKDKKASIPPSLLSFIESLQRKSPPVSPKVRPIQSGFPSDESKAAFPNLGALVVNDSESAVALLGDSFAQPPPQYVGGSRILAECPEFRLIQYGGPEGPSRVEMSYAIQRANAKSTTGVNNDADGSDTWERRASLALALQRLSDYTAFNMAGIVALRDTFKMTPAQQTRADRGAPMTVLLHLASTLGLAIEELWESKDPEQTIRETVALFESGLYGFARCESILRDRRRQHGPRPHDAIERGKSIFEESRNRPTKSAIIEALWRDDRFTFRGKNARSKWKDLFLAAGLSDLAD